MMLSQQALAEIKTAPISDPYHGIYLIAQGYYKCRPCRLYIYNGGSNRCPFCKKIMSRRYPKAKTRERLKQILKNPTRPVKPKRSCSCCGKDTYLCAHMWRSGRKYAAWYKDGNGGFLCSRCYKKRLKLASCESRT